MCNVCGQWNHVRSFDLVAAANGPEPLSASAAARPAEVSPFGSAPWSNVTGNGTVPVNGLVAGTKWGAGAAGTAVTVEYSFPGVGATWEAGYGNGEPLNGYAPLTAEQRVAAVKALNAWNEVCNINFTQVTETASNVGAIRFANSSVPSTAWAYYPGGTPETGDVWFGGTEDYGSSVDGTYSYATFLHEIGHALGLKHPHDGAALPVALDYLGNSIMSYRDNVGASVLGGYSSSFLPTTPMLYDILAMQHLYGVDTTTRTGATVYSWTPGEQLFETIWDAGGIDTISWANQTTAAVINLNPGSWSQLGPARTYIGGSDANTLAIAFNCNIENATGGSAADTIRGNALANTLRGGAGNDTVLGGLGGDLIYGDANDDLLYGEAGIDLVAGGDGNDRVSGGADNDRVWGDAGNDRVWGDAGVDQVYGGVGDDILYGDGSPELATDGADQVFGGAGLDTLYGGGGGDQLYGEDAADTLYGGTGNDRIDGGLDRDTVSYANATGAVTVQLWNTGAVSGADGLDTLVAVERVRGSNFNDRLEGASTTGTGVTTALDLFGLAGNDIVVGGASTDVLEGNDGLDDLSGRAGNDRLSGGNGDDVLRGQGGTDQLFGDAGNDRFDFDALVDSVVGVTRDSVFGFAGAGAALGDRIDLSTIDANSVLAGDQAFLFRGTGAFTGAGQLRLAASGVDTILQLNVDATLTADFELRIAGVSAASFVAADFVA